MDYVIIKKEWSSYDIYESNQSFLNNLANFLIIDCEVGLYKEWLESSESEIIGDISWVEKLNDNILIGFAYYEDIGVNKYDNHFTINKEHFVQISRIVKFKNN